jgi:hypothetical protein
VRKTIDFQLTLEHKNRIIEEFKKNPNLMHIVRTVFEDDKLDGRSAQGLATRKFLADQGSKPKTSKFEKVEHVELTPEQKKFMMGNNIEAGMNALEVARLVFQDMEIGPLTIKHRVVDEFLKKYRPDVVDARESLATDSWSPPKALSRAIKKVNDFTGSSFDEVTCPTKVKRNCEKLLIYLQSPRFNQFINNYNKSGDRDLFEAEFVRAVWDKPDLTIDELNNYVTVCANYIRQQHIQARLDKLNALLDDSDDERDITLRLTEIIKATSEELNQCEKRIEGMTKDLNGSRTARLKTQGEQTSNILALVQAFQEVEERNRMIMMADMQNKLVEEEVDRLESMDEFKARILGISKREIL